MKRGIDASTRPCRIKKLWVRVAGRAFLVLGICTLLNHDEEVSNKVAAQICMHRLLFRDSTSHHLRSSALIP